MIMFLLSINGCGTLPTPPNAKPELDAINTNQGAILASAQVVKKEVAAGIVANTAGQKAQVASSLSTIGKEAAKVESACLTIDGSYDSLIVKSEEAGKVVTELKAQISTLNTKLDKVVADGEKTAVALKDANEKIADQDKTIIKLKDKQTTWIFAAMIIVGSLLLASSIALGIYVKPSAGIFAGIVGFSLLGIGWFLQSYMALIGTIMLWTFGIASVGGVAALIYVIVKKQRSLNQVVSSFEAAKTAITPEVKEAMSNIISKVQTLDTEAEVLKIKAALGLLQPTVAVPAKLTPVAAKP
jgi:hypothetical protein